VLSIGKLSAGQARYYLEQGEVRVDAVDSIGDGVEEYYAGGTEARGTWIGGAARSLGLSEGVDGDALRRVLDGLDPHDGSPLRESSSPVKVAGFDLTFSAPKSVSVVFALGDREIRAAVRGAHDRATREAVLYLEHSAAAVRRGHGGARVELASGLVAAAFRHRTSRLGDPQLHTHVLVANLGRGPDGRWSALDGRQLYSHARAASFVYQAVLRAELTRMLGLEWLPVRNGIAELFGLPKPVLRAFSRRRAQIEAGGGPRRPAGPPAPGAEAALAERGTSGPRAAEAAALATRQAKRSVTDSAGLEQVWRERAAALGFAREDLGRLVGRTRAVQLAPNVWERVLDGLASPAGLTHRTSTFSRRDVVQALCDRLPAGAPVDAPALEAAADRFLASSRAVVLLPDGHAGEAFRRRDGRRMPVAAEERVYSTPELLALEQRLVEHARDARNAGVGIAHDRAVRAAVTARRTLSGEQKAMVEGLCRGGDGVSVVVGKAGTGKTFALAAAREAWQAAGLPVLGVAVARRAARELEHDAGIHSTSVAALLGDVRRRGPAALPRQCILVVDEAGMVATRQLAALADAVQAVQGKLVLVGDHRQLPELEAGGAFRGLVSRGLAIELTENRRQIHGWERAALDLLRDDQSERALALYQQHERVQVADSATQARQRLVADWAATGDSAGSVMLAHRRDEVAELNTLARSHLRQAGALGDRELQLPGGGFAVGDQVLIKRNDLRRGVVNGDRGRVSAVDLEARQLTLDVGGEQITLDSDYLDDRTAHGDPTLQHGYAMTVHVAQGLTVDHAFVLASGLDRETGYTAMSRGRDTNRLYVARHHDSPRVEYAPREPHHEEPIARLARQLVTSSATELAIDTGQSDLATAQREHALAVERRREREATRRWLPGRRRELEGLRVAEGVAARRVADLQRERQERSHGDRPFVTERQLEVDAARIAERVAERRLEREQRRNLGRGLER
jgi:conjugative relaxase-like TrwC/TraI family protein